MKKFYLLLCLLMFTSLSFSQQWLNNLPKNKTKNALTLFDYKNAFNSYWAPYKVKDGYYTENGIKKKAPGWKQFKRWEYDMENQVNPITGAFPTKTAEKVYEEYKASQPALKNTNAANWVSMGSNSSTGGYAGIGRINCIAFHPTDNNTYWVGAASGGLWVTSNNGSSWTCLTDNNGVLAVSDIVIPSDYATSNTIYIATGDRDAWDNRSIGVLKSTNGGASWNATGLSYTLANNSMVNRLLLDPTNNQNIIAATSNGVYKTTNGGAVWNTQLSTNDYIDMEFKPGNFNTIYGSTKSGSIYVSSNGGTSWTQAYSNSNAHRIELAVSASQPNWVYAVAVGSDNGLYAILKSTTSGSNYSQVYAGTTSNLLGWYSDGSDAGGQGFYDLSMAVSPTNANIVLIGGINSHISTNGGTSWTCSNCWTSNYQYNFGSFPVVHADKHCLKFRSNGDLFECNDGGIYLSSNIGASWTDKTNGMTIGQIYKLGVSQTVSNEVITGLQDNGTKLLSGGNWYDVKSGDGMECLIDYTNADVQYGTYVNGQITRTTDHWVNDYTNIEPISAGDGAWVTPYIIDPINNQTLYAGYADVWKTTNRGNSWTQISSMNTSYKIRSMAIAPSNNQVLYVADPYIIWKTINGGTTWTDITGTLPVSSGNITNIAVKNNDVNTVWVTFSGYNATRVFQTTNGGSTWTDISAGLPALPAYSLVQNKQSTTEVQLYVATELGVFYKKGTANWVAFNTGLPNVKIREIEIYYDAIPQNSKLRAATYGRGLWESTVDYASCTPPTIQATTFTSSSITTTAMTTSWTRGNGTAGVIVIARAGSAVNADPVSGTTYTANASFGSGDQIGTGNYVVYKGTGTSVNVTALAAGATYYYAIYEYNTTGICYKTPALVGNANTTAVPTLTISPSSQNISSSAGSTQFTVNSTVAWAASSNQTWCTVTPSGTGNGTITANYTANSSSTSRTAIITVSGTGVSPIAVNVIQNGLTSTIWSSTMSNTSEWVVSNASNATLSTQWVRLADTSYASTPWKTYVGSYMGSATPMNGVYYFDGITNLLNGNYGVSNSRLTNSSPINTLGYSSVKIKFYQLYKSFNADSTLLEISSDNVNWHIIDVNPTIAANQYAYGWKEYNIGPWAGNKAQVWIRFRFYAPAVSGNPPQAQYSGGYGWMIDDVSISENVQNSLIFDKLWIYDGYTQIPLQQNRSFSLLGQITNDGAATQTNVKLKAKELISSTIFSNTSSQSIATAITDTIELDSITLPNVAGDYYIAPYVSSNNISQVLFNDTIKITLNNTNQFSRDYNNYYTSRGYNGTPYTAVNLYEVKQQCLASSINFVVNLATKVNSNVRAVLYRGGGQNMTLITQSNLYSISASDIPTNAGISNPPSITLTFTTPATLVPDSLYWVGVESYGGNDTVRIAVDNTTSMQNYYTSMVKLNNQWYTWSMDQIYPLMIRLNLNGATLTVTPQTQNVNSASGASQFAVTSTVAWTAISNQTWCTVTPSGTGNGMITANYIANSSSLSRTATITVSASGVTPVTLTLVQSGTGSIIWPQSFEEANFPPTGWSVQNPNNGTGWESSVLGTTPVPGFNGGSVTSCPGGGNKMALVYYGSGSATSNNQWLISPAVTITANKVLKFYLRKFGEYADTVHIKVSTTGNQISNFTNQLAIIGFAAVDSGWIQYTYNLAAYNGQQIYFAFNEKINDNQTNGAAIFLDMIDIVDNTSNPNLSVTPQSQNVSSSAGSAQFTVTSNVAWTATSNQTWCTVTPSGTGNGIITADYTANSSSLSRTATITVSASGVTPVILTVVQSGTTIPDPAGVISGLTTVCQGQNNVIYTVPIINNATIYIWTLPNGAVGSSTSNSIIVNYGTTSVSGNITVKGSNTSGDGIASTLSVIINPLPLAAGSISGQTTICQGQSNVIYTVSNITNATSYLWTLPNGAIGTSSSNSIVISYVSSSVSGNITVKGQNSCGVGVLSSLFVVVNQTPPIPIITQNANTLISNAVNGNQWYDLASGIISNANNQTYLPQQIGNYFVIVNLNGCSSDSSNIIYYDNTGITAIQSNSMDIKVMPNPFSLKTTISYTLNESKYIRLSITDITGREIEVLCDEKREKGEHTIVFNANHLSKGIYFYKLNADNEEFTGKMILTK